MKIITFLILVCSSANLSAQVNPDNKKGDGLLNVLNALNNGLDAYNNAKNNNSTKSNSELSNGGMNKSDKQWSEWRSCPSFNKIEYSVIFDGKVVGTANRFNWRVKFRNEYGRPVYGEYIIGSDKYEAENNYRSIKTGFSLTPDEIPVDIIGNLWLDFTQDNLNQITSTSGSQIYVDVSQLSYGSSGNDIKLRTDNGQICLSCKVYPGRCQN